MTWREAFCFVFWTLSQMIGRRDGSKPPIHVISVKPFSWLLLKEVVYTDRCAELPGLTSMQKFISVWPLIHHDCQTSGRNSKIPWATKQGSPFISQQLQTGYISDFNESAKLANPEHGAFSFNWSPWGQASFRHLHFQELRHDTRPRYFKSRRGTSGLFSPKL